MINDQEHRLVKRYNPAQPKRGVRVLWIVDYPVPPHSNVGDIHVQTVSNYSHDAPAQPKGIELP